jgi:hypothetical protein
MREITENYELASLREADIYTAPGISIDISFRTALK